MSLIVFLFGFIAYNRGGDDMKKDKNMIRFTMTAMFMALTIALSSFGIPVPGGHLYLNDMVIVTGALLLNPLEALLAGGIGAFLGDAIFYPAPMFVSLVTHGLQAYVISKLAHNQDGSRKSFTHCLVAVLVGAIVMVGGYTYGRAMIYATYEAAMLKLPFQVLQALFGVVVSLVVVFKTSIPEVFDRKVKR